MLDYISVASHGDVKVILETGFNAGHSSTLMLEANPGAVLYSFTMWACQEGLEFVEQRFPGRFHIIKGDSAVTLPRFIQDNPSLVADLIVIDGNHKTPGPYIDFINFLPRTRVGTRYIFDGVTPDTTWVLQQGLAIELFRHRGHFLRLKGQDDASIGDRVPAPGKPQIRYGHTNRWTCGVVMKPIGFDERKAYLRNATKAAN